MPEPLNRTLQSPQAARRLVGSLQRQLMQLYELDLAFHAHDFLLTDAATAAKLAGDGYRHSVETLLVRDTGETLELSLFLDPELLARLSQHVSTPLTDNAALEDFWSVLEGISHFNYLVYNAQREQSVRAVELELQAEVDKYMMTLLSGGEPGSSGTAARIHHLLFECTRFDPRLETGDRERYRSADRHAGRYCLSLLRRFASARHPGLHRELRRFYRLDHQAKLRFIERCD